jgi:hypothetical protein
MCNPVNIFEFSQKILPHLSAPLASDRCRQKLMQLSQDFPKDLASHFLIFESHLSKDPPQLDFGINLTPTRDNLSILQRCFPEIDWHSLYSVDSLDQPTMWLEFDVGSGKIDLPTHFLICGRTEEKIFYEYITKIFCRDSDVRDILQRCMEVCQRMGLIVWFCGDMLARGLNGVRLGIFCTKLDNINWIECFLKEIGYEYDCKKVLFLIDSFLDKISFTIDVGKKINERLGIECYAQSSQNQNSMRCIFDSLADLMIPNRTDACLAWSGISKYKELLPNGTHQGYKISRNVSHLKLVLQPRQPIEMKIYLGALHERMPDFG